MTLPVQFRRAARSEFNEAAARYETQRVGLGMDFIVEIERCLALAAENSRQFPIVHQGIRRITVRRFPFSIYFRAESARIVVLAIFHGRRDPAIWRSRI